MALSYLLQIQGLLNRRHYQTTENFEKIDWKFANVMCRAELMPLTQRLCVLHGMWKRHVERPWINILKGLSIQMTLLLKLELIAECLKTWPLSRLAKAQAHVVTCTWPEFHNREKRNLAGEWWRDCEGISYWAPVIWHSLLVDPMLSLALGRVHALTSGNPYVQYVESSVVALSSLHLKKW